MTMKLNGLPMLVLTMSILHSHSSRVTFMDLSYEVSENSMYWPTLIPPKITNNVVDPGYWYTSNTICMAEHTSTHLDAPIHFAEGKWSVEQIPLAHLIGPVVVISIEEKVKLNSTAQLTEDDVNDWIEENGQIPDGAVVLIRFGWGERYGDKKRYFGTETNDTKQMLFPGIHVSAARVFSSYKSKTGNKIVGVGVDGPSLDHKPSDRAETHQELSRNNIYGLENVANMQRLPTTGAEVLIMPMKIKGGSGGPARIVAAVPGFGYSSDTCKNVPFSSVFILSLICLTLLAI